MYDNFTELGSQVVEQYSCEGWYYLTSYSNIIAESGVSNKPNMFIYNPGHGNPQIIEATTYDIMCGSQVAVPRGRKAIVSLVSYVLGRPNSRWSIKLLSDES